MHLEVRPRHSFENHFPVANGHLAAAMSRASPQWKGGKLLSICRDSIQSTLQRINLTKICETSAPSLFPWSLRAITLYDARAGAGGSIR